LSVLWLRWIVAGLSPRRPGFAPGPHHVGFLVDKVALGRFYPSYLVFLHPYCSTAALHSCIIRRINSSETLSITPSTRAAARLNDVRATSSRAGRSLQSAPLVRFQASGALQSSVEAVHPESQMEPRTELRERHVGLRGCGTDSYHSPINVIGYKLEHPSPLILV